jgi:hypothetical protein
LYLESIEDTLDFNYLTRLVIMNMWAAHLVKHIWRRIQHTQSDNR